jgi:hypothetical protein
MAVYLDKANHRAGMGGRMQPAKTWFGTTAMCVCVALLRYNDDTRARQRSQGHDSFDEQRASTFRVL